MSEMDNVFKELDEAQAAIHAPEPTPAPLPTPPPAPMVDPAVFALQQQVGQLQQALGQVVGALQPQQPQVDPRLLQQEREYFSESDAAALLHGQQPIKQLNKMANQIRDDVAGPLIQTIQQQQYQLQQHQAFQQQQYQRQEMDRQEKANAERFFGNYADLKPYEKLVRIEAQQMALEAQQNPYIFGGKDPQQVLAERVRGTVKEWGVGAQPTTPAEGPHGLSPNTRRQSTAPYMEQGSGTRAVGTGTAPRSANDRELDAMSKNMQRQRTR